MSIQMRAEKICGLMSVERSVPMSTSASTPIRASSAVCPSRIHWAIITLNFFIVQIAPGGPADQAIAAVEFGQQGSLPGGGGGMGGGQSRAGVSNIAESQYRGGRGLDPEVIAEITQRYGFDKPLHERYFKMLGDYLRFDFGNSLFRNASVMQLMKESLPVSVTLGLWSTLIIYLVSIPLGIRKAVYNGSRFDIWSSTFIIIG